MSLRINRRILTSPIEDVPQDILQEIFLQCLPEHTWRISLTPSECPVLLTHVCQKWRRVSFAFPSLWKNLRCNTLRIKFNKTMMQLLAAASARAKLHPRTLQVIVRTRPWIEDKRNNDASHPVPNIIGILTAPNISSLTSLTLIGIPVAHLHRLPRGSFPSLEDLILTLHEDIHRFPWATKGPIEAFSAAPALRRLCLDAFYLLNNRGRERYASNHVTFPWEQLTYLLDLSSHSDLSPLFLHLPECMNLRYLFASMGDDDCGETGRLNWAANPPSRLGELRSLTLFFWGSIRGDVAYPAFIDVFDFPNLEALRVEGAKFDFDDGSFDNWDPLALIDRFLSKLSSLHHLTYLSLSICSTTSDTLRQLFQAMPHITILDASVYDNYEFFFEGLQWGAERLLPKLETLVLDLDASWASDNPELEEETIDSHTFLEFLESRIGNAERGSFRKVVVYSSSNKAIGDEVPFVEVALQYVPRGLLFEKRMVSEERENRLSDQWKDRDPWLSSWPEVVEMR